MKVLAYDTSGNRFEKEVTTFTRKDGPTISFGFPVQYYVADLERGYPFEKALCIDMGGANHQMKSTYIGSNNMNEIIKAYRNGELEVRDR